MYWANKASAFAPAPGFNLLQIVQLGELLTSVFIADLVQPFRGVEAEQLESLFSGVDTLFLMAVPAQERVIGVSVRIRFWLFKFLWQGRTAADKKEGKGER